MRNATPRKTFQTCYILAINITDRQTDGQIERQRQTEREREREMRLQSRDTGGKLDEVWREPRPLEWFIGQQFDDLCHVFIRLTNNQQTHRHCSTSHRLTDTAAHLTDSQTPQHISQTHRHRSTSHRLTDTAAHLTDTAAHLTDSQTPQHISQTHRHRSTSHIYTGRLTDVSEPLT